MLETIVAIRGGGDIATAVAYKLHRCGFKILILEIEKPEVIRLKAAFASAVFTGVSSVEGVSAERVESESQIKRCWSRGIIPVLIDPVCNILKDLKPEVLIDSILAKKNLGMKMNLAPLTIALGPGFEAGKDVHIVIETQRGHNLGKIIYNGTAEKNTGIPGTVNGFSSERVLRSPAEGRIKNIKCIGDHVSAGDIIAHIISDSHKSFKGIPVKTLSSAELKAPISGVIRGLIYDESIVHHGMKIGDIDPRGDVSYCSTISDKGRAIAGGILEAILAWKNENAKEILNE